MDSIKKTNVAENLPNKTIETAKMVEQKLTRLILAYFLFTLIFISACATKVKENERVDDSTQIIENAPSSNVVSQQEAQTELDKITQGFESRKSGFALSYNSEYSVGGSEFEFYYDQTFSIKYKHSSESEEGGYMKSLTTEYLSDHAVRSVKQVQSGNPDFIAFGYYKNDHLSFKNVILESYTKDGRGYYNYKISNDAIPESADIAELMQDFDVKKEPHLKIVLANLKRFRLLKGRYEFYLRGDTIEREESGRADFEVYRIDSALFISKFTRK